MIRGFGDKFEVKEKQTTSPQYKHLFFYYAKSCAVKVVCK